VGGRADVVFSQGYRQPAARRGAQRDVAGVRTSELTAASPEEATTGWPRRSPNRAPAAACASWRARSEGEGMAPV